MFFRARDPDALRDWYAEHLGVPVDDEGYVMFPESRDTDWAPFAGDDATTGRPRSRAWSTSRSRAWTRCARSFVTAGVEVDDRTEELEGIGRFGWAVDPEGNRFELWEPSGRDS